MYCLKCGTQNTAISKFCMKCGAQLPESNKHQSSSNPKNNSPQSPSKIDSQPVTKKSLGISTIFEVLAALVVIIGFIFGVTKWGDIQQYFWRQHIVGTWQDQSGVLITFDSDGNFTSGGLLPANGNYTFTDSDHIVLQVSGLLGITGNQAMEVNFSGNAMTWVDQALGTKYTYKKVLGVEKGSIPSTPNVVKIPPSTPEQIAVQNVFTEILSKQSIDVNQLRNIEYTTKDNDGKNAIVVVYFDLLEPSSQVWLPQASLTIETRFLTGKWNVDVQNAHLALSPEAEATIASLQNSTQEANNQQATQQAITNQKKFGGVLVFKTDCPKNTICFGVMDQSGNKTTIYPSVPASESDLSISAFAIAPAGDRLFFAYTEFNYEKSITHIYSCDLAGNDSKLISTIEKLQHLHQMAISPDGQLIALNISIGEGILYVPSGGGESKLLWSNAKSDGHAGGLAWSADSKELFAIFSREIENFKCSIFLEKVALDGSGIIQKVKDISVVDQCISPWDSLLFVPGGNDVILNLEDSNTRPGIALISLNKDSVYFLREGKYYCHLKISADGNRLVYVWDGNLFILDLASGEEFFVTNMPQINNTSCLGGEIDWIESNSFQLSKSSTGLQLVKVNNTDQVNDSISRMVREKLNLQGNIDPGLYSANLTINFNQSLGFAGWCAIDSDTLENNMAKIQYTLIIDEVSIDLMKFGRVNYKTVRDQYCTIPASMLVFPPGNYHVVFTAHYLDQVNDGWGVYPSGEWVNDVQLTVK